MGSNTMTAEARLVATIKLESVDRVVCAPETGNYAGQYVGITNKEFVWKFDTRGLAAIGKLANDYRCGIAVLTLTVLPVLMLLSDLGWVR